MSRTKNCIEMIKILSDGNTHGISELARRLETNPRNIVEYRKEISDAGYYIEPIPGRYGGYKMHKESMFPCLKLMPAERMALSVGTGYLAARKDFPYKEEYKSAMEKVFCSDNREVIPFNPTVIPRYPLVMNEVALKERYDIINKAINQKHCNITELNYVNLGTVIQAMIDGLKKENYIRKTKGEMKQLLADAYESDKLAEDELSPSVLRDIKKTIEKRNKL